jgi:hypothetical protein
MTDPIENALTAFEKHLLESNMSDLARMLDLNKRLIREMAIFLLVKGIKIGGIYRHWKGPRYIVTGIARDADNWETFQVEYCEIGNATHKAHRPIMDFLGIHPESGLPRFQLVSDQE